MEYEPKKIRIKRPSDHAPKRTEISEKSRSYIFLILFFLVPILIFSASLMLFLLAPSPHPSYPFELGRFSGTAEIYSHKTKELTTITRRSHRQIVLNVRDKIKTQSDSDLDFKIPGVLDLRLKASSELEVVRPKNEEELKFKLNKGGLLGLTSDQFGNRSIEVQTPRLTALIRNASFLIQTGKVYSAASALTGEITVKLGKPKKTFTVAPLEIFTMTDDKKIEPKPKRVNYQEWKTLSEARDLTDVSIEQIAEQVDLRKKAGNFFKYVFDEGVFFKPNSGYAEREFYEDPESKEIVLRIDYDVFPPGSFSGVYFKIRNLDLSKVHRISLNVKSDPQKPAPKQFRIELKDQFTIVRGFSVTPIAKDWKNYSFDLNATKSTLIAEMVFVFENSRVGPLNANGIIYVKDLMIE